MEKEEDAVKDVVVVVEVCRQTIFLSQLMLTL